MERTVKHSLSGMRVACYYGCQILRRYCTFDDQYAPITMVTVYYSLWGWKPSSMAAQSTLLRRVPDMDDCYDVVLRLNYILLREAQRRGADVMATIVPTLCQLNLKRYFDQMNRSFDEENRSAGQTIFLSCWELRIEFRKDGRKRLISRQNYGDRIECEFGMSRQGARWRFQRLFNEIYVEAYEQILWLESNFGPELRHYAMAIAKQRMDLCRLAQKRAETSLQSRRGLAESTDDGRGEES